MAARASLHLDTSKIHTSPTRPLSPAERIKTERSQRDDGELTSRSNNHGDVSHLEALGHLMGSDMIVGNYALGKVLGKGAFGTTRVGTHTETKDSVAIKIYDKRTVASLGQELSHRITAEISALESVGGHDGVVGLHDVIHTTTSICLVLEFVGGGTLEDCMKRGMTLPEAISLFKGIASAVSYCHQRSVLDYFC